MSRSSWFVRLLSSSLWGVMLLFLFALLYERSRAELHVVVAFTLYFGITDVLAVIAIGTLFRPRLLALNRRTTLAALGLSIATTVLLIAISAVYRTSNDLPTSLVWICAVVLSLAVFALRRSS